MSEDATPLIQPASPGWWKRRSKKSKVFLIALVLVVGLVAISIAAGGSGTEGSPNAAATDPSGAETSAPAEAAPIMHGTWKNDCNRYSAGDFNACKAVKVSQVTCQWQENNVHMSAAFENTFAAHVTMHMQPTYNLLNAGLHGNGLNSVKDIGLDAGETRTVTVDENPAGVDTHPRITSCRPGVDALQGVELG